MPPWFLCLLAEASINVSLEVDNPLKVLVNTSVVYLRWTYTISSDEEVTLVDFHFGAEDVHIGFINSTQPEVSSKFRDRFKLELPATLIIHNVNASDTGKYKIALTTNQSTQVESFVYLDVLGKL